MWNGTPPEQYTLLEVTWLDSNTETGWHSISMLRRTAMEQGMDAMYVTSVGFYLFETELNIALAMSVGRNDDALDVLYIPTASIQEAQILRHKVRAEMAPATGIGPARHSP